MVGGGHRPEAHARRYTKTARQALELLDGGLYVFGEAL